MRKEIVVELSDTDPETFILTFPVAMQNMIKNADGTWSFAYPVKANDLAAVCNAITRVECYRQREAALARPIDLGKGTLPHPFEE